MKITGSNLKLERLKAKLSQSKLAEVSGVEQHLISAFELEKISLPSHIVMKIKNVLNDSEKIKKVIDRPKRYRNHEYVAIVHDNTRIEKASQTEGNKQYLEILDRIWRSHLNESNKFNSAISLFSGCGGLSLGFSAAGYKIKGFLELDQNLRSIYRNNFCDSLEMGGDITLVSQEEIYRYKQLIGDVDLIIGGPPCQGFSLSGKRNVDDPRNQLFKHYLRFVDVFKPKVALLENVRLLTSMKNNNDGYVLDDIYSSFRIHGYRIKHFDINAKNYGVPQHRARVLFLALREDIAAEVYLPQNSYHLQNDTIESIFSLRTFADACSDLPYIESGEKSDVQFHESVKHPAHVIDWLWNVREGESAHDNLEISKRPPSGYNTTYKRQIWNEPASTVQTTFGMISGCRNVHPIATRSLTIREAARIQSFPDQFQFIGKLGDIRTGIGNAVPPLMAYAIAQYLKKYI